MKKGLRKRSMGLLLSLAVGFCPLAVSAADGGQEAADGSYSSTEHVEVYAVHNGQEHLTQEYDITVKLAVSSGLFSDVKVIFIQGDSYDLNEDFVLQAERGLSSVLKNKPATPDTINAFDGVAGATYSSRAARQGALNALSNGPESNGPENPSVPEDPGESETPTEPAVDPALTAFESGKPAISSVKADSSTQVKVTWKAFKNADSYNILRKSKGGKWETLKTGVKELAYTDKKAKEGVTYYYGVEAVSSRWGSPVTSAYASKSVTTPLMSVGRAAISKVSSTAYNKLKITWKKVNGATGYLVSRSTSKSGKYKVVKTVNKGTTVSYTDTSLTTGKTYYYKVKAFRKGNGKTVKGTDSAYKSGKPILKKPALTLKAGKKRAVLKWKKVSGANGYEIRRAVSKNGSYQAVKTIKKGGTISYTNKKLTSKKNYYYKIRAYRTVSGRKVYSSWSAVQKGKAK